MKVRGFGVVVVLAVIGFVGLWVARCSAALGIEDARELGRYQALVVGSQTRLLAVSLLLDTKTGATKKTAVRGNEAQPWSDVLESPPDLPESAQAVGRYQISVAYVADKIDQETAGAVRVDTATGKSWYLQVNYPVWRWITIPASLGTKVEGPGKK